MVGIVVVGHAGLAQALVDAVAAIAGPQEALIAVDLASDQSPESFQAALLQALQQADRGEGVLLLADMAGGTPANQALLLRRSLALPRPYPIVAGVNLPLLLEVALVRTDTTPEALARRATTAGIQSVRRLA